MDFKRFLEFSDTQAILDRLPSMDFEQQAELDKKLHNMAVNNNTFGMIGSSKLLSDKGTKTDFERILAGNRDPNLIRLTISKLRDDQKDHAVYITQYPDTEKTGNRAWHMAWMNVYERWIRWLNKLLSGQ
jgi:hypothetical protein